MHHYIYICVCVCLYMYICLHVDLDFLNISANLYTIANDDILDALQALDALDLETRTTGLGFVDLESAGCTNHFFDAEKSGNIADSELNSVEDRNVAALEAMKVDIDQDYLLHLKTSVDDKNFRSTPRSKKNRRGRSFEMSSVKEKNAGYLSIGGVKIFTEAGITFSDESEDLDGGSDVCLELDFSSGKKRRNKGSKKFTSKDKKSLRSSGVHQRGQWLEDTISGSGESIVDSSDLDIDDDLVADYMANVAGTDEMLDDTWLLKNKLQHVGFEDMGSEDWEDEDEEDDNTSTDASGSGDDSIDSSCASPGGSSILYLFISVSSSVTSWFEMLGSKLVLFSAVGVQLFG